MVKEAKLHDEILCHLEVVVAVLWNVVDTASSDGSNCARDCDSYRVNGMRW